MLVIYEFKATVSAYTVNDVGVNMSFNIAWDKGLEFRGNFVFGRNLD